MSFLFSALILMLLLVLFLFLGIGLVLILGVVLVIAVGFAAFHFFFMGGELKGKDIPQRFNHCLLEEPAESCLNEWTSWDKDRIDIVKSLSQQVKTQLGERGYAQSTEYASDSRNGQQTIRMDFITDYEKKKSVHEHYLLVKKDGDLKIQDLKWDY